MNRMPPLDERGGGVGRWLWRVGTGAPGDGGDRGVLDHVPWAAVDTGGLRAFFRGCAPCVRIGGDGGVAGGRDLVSRGRAQ